MLWMIQGRNSLRELIATLMKPELSGSCRYLLYCDSYVFLDRKHMSQVPRNWLVGSVPTHCSRGGSHSPPLSACAVGAIPQEAVDKLPPHSWAANIVSTWGPQGSSQVHLLPFSTQIPKGKIHPFTQTEVYHSTLSLCSVWAFCQWQFAEHKQ